MKADCTTTGPWDSFFVILKKRLVPLTAQQQIAFGALCCQRHLPEFIAFRAEQGWGDLDPFSRALDLAWLQVSVDRVEREDVENLLKQCEAETPDADDFPNVESIGCAQDAAIMVCHLVEFLGTGDPSSVLDIASRARDLIDAKVQILREFNAFDPMIEHQIASDPLMVSEICKQKGDLESVERSTDPRDVVRLRQRTILDRHKG